MKSWYQSQITHLIAGLLVILHGVNEWDKTYGSPAFYLVSGVLMLLLFYYQPGAEKRIGSAFGLVFLIEAVILIFIAFHYFEVGKGALPFAYLLIAAFYLSAGWTRINSKRKIKTSKH
jgi:hypothetical protein